MSLRMILAAALAFLFAAAPAQAATEVVLWHAMPGKLGEWLGDLVEGFNKRQADYKVVAQYKGNYRDTMQAALDAFTDKRAPHMVQVFEVGTATMMAAKGVIKPVHEVMSQAGLAFDAKDYLPAVTLYYSSMDGKLLSLPFNASTPVLFYNKRAFRQAGLDPNQPPKTWPDVEDAARALLKAGFPCGFTTQWQSWIQLENLSAWHDMPFATKQNGIGGYDIELKFNSPFHIHHIQKLADWSKSKIFVYAGRRDEALGKFIDGDCPMLFATSASYGEVGGNANLDFSIAMLPYWPDIRWAPRNSIIGGATLWVMEGHQTEEYRGIAKFFEYLSSPAIQATSHQRTGYLPITRAAYSLSRRQGFYDSHPETETAIKQVTLHWPTEHSRGVRLGNFAQVRDVIDEELEAVWAGRKSAKNALDEAVRRGNEILKKFTRDNGQ